MTTGGWNPNPDPNFDPNLGDPNLGDPNLGQAPGYPPPPDPYGQGYPPPPPPNPYGAPGGYPSQPPAGWGAQPGGLGVRWGARIIDGLLVGIVSWLLALVFGASSNVLVTGLFSGVLMFAYFVAMEVTQGRTLGKSLLGLRVHGPGGAPKPDLKQSAIRNAFTLLTVVPYVGGLLAVIAYIVIAITINNSPTKQGKHDELAGGTQVVKQ
jgi:uncharacterized RDD family membrane protein YckC